MTTRSHSNEVIHLRQDISTLLDLLGSLDLSRPHTAAAGFDAVIDRIQRPFRISGSLPSFYSSLQDFGAAIQASPGSCTVETSGLDRRGGGNMPNFVRALTRLGVQAACVGPMGDKALCPEFQDISCQAYSVGDPGECLALEFPDGKLMLSCPGESAELSWPLLVQRIGASTLRTLFGGAELAAFLNWAEIRNATALWEDVFQACILPANPDQSKYLLIDITDCSAHPADELLQLAQTLRRFSTYRALVMSFNEKEASLFSGVLGISGPDQPEFCRGLERALGATMVVIHGKRQCWFSQKRGPQGSVPAFWMERPLVSTGCGDTFNGGLAFGLLHGLSLPQACLFANATAACYISSGLAPTVEDITAFLRRSG